MLPLTKLRKYIYYHYEEKNKTSTYINNLISGYSRDYVPYFLLEEIILSLNIGQFNYTFIIYSDNNCIYNVYYGLTRILYIEQINVNTIKMILDKEYYKNTDIFTDMVEHNFHNIYGCIYRTNTHKFIKSHIKYFEEHF